MELSPEELTSFAGSPFIVRMHIQIRSTRIAMRCILYFAFSRLIDILTPFYILTDHVGKSTVTTTRVITIDIIETTYIPGHNYIHTLNESMQASSSGSIGITSAGTPVSRYTQHDTVPHFFQFVRQLLDILIAVTTFSRIETYPPKSN